MSEGRDHGTGGAPGWRGFVALFLAAAFVLGIAAIGFVAALDPYGLRAAPGGRRGPLMDANQRFMYPQVARGGGYDAAVIGTSTARLIDPRALDEAFGARFANLAMNAATPYEQTRLARLFLRRDAVRAVIFALDANWCEADALTHRLTARPFPPWLYEPGTPWGVLLQVNWQSLGTASRVLLHRLGLAPERIRGNGFSVFTPPESHWDPVRAAAHIHGGRNALDEPDAEGPPPDNAPIAADAPMPALAWLDALLSEMPPDSLKLVAFMPVHAAAQGRPGTARGARESACKARSPRSAPRGASVLDFRIPPRHLDDANYWDALHYRLPVAARIVAALKAARASGRDDPDGFYRVLSP